jgi:NitT/TauT family transport system substrate-binding protein
MPLIQTRRRFLTTLSLAGAAGLLRPPRASAAEGALETTTVRLPKVFGVCISPQDVAEELLRAEGFTDVRYIETEAARVAGALGHGKLDFGLNYAPLAIPAIDTGELLTMLAGRYSAVLRSAYARSGVHQIEPTENHRRRYRLALPGRSQTRAKGVSAIRLGSLFLTLPTRALTGQQVMAPDG